MWTTLNQGKKCISQSGEDIYGNNYYKGLVGTIKMYDDEDEHYLVEWPGENNWIFHNRYDIQIISEV